MSANQMQVGGTHYKTDYEHWDLIIKIGLGYLEGTSTKYIARYRKKGGVEDLRKALHYLDKLIEAFTAKEYGQTRNLRKEDIRTEVGKFCRINQIPFNEEHLLFALCTFESYKDLKGARYMLEEIIVEAAHL